MQNIRELQKIADGIDAIACVMSVEKLPEGGCGKIRIVTGNRAYLDSVEHPAPGTELLTKKFVPNSEYTRYFTRDLNFEDYCFRSAVQKKCLHSYVHPDRMDVWFNMTFMPLAVRDDELAYCIYTMEIDFSPRTEAMSNISGNLASAVLETALKLSNARDFPTAMGEVIKDVRRICGAEYCCVLLMDRERRSCSVLCEDLAEDSVLERKETLDGESFYALAESWDDTIAGSNCLIIKNERDMEVVRERNPRWHRSLTANGIERIVLFPLKNQKDLLGYIWATNFDPESAGKIKETLELTTFILGAEIANHLLLKQLRHMGSTDFLTGLGNRNEMTRRIAAFAAEEPPRRLGLVFIDLNGLKAVNDSMGHDAGDAMLRSAAEALRTAFGGVEVYRSGGDEFVAFLPGASEDELERRAERLRECARRFDNVSFAIGCCVADDGDMERALQIADERMYRDKRRYYTEHPEKDRRLRKGQG